MGHPNINNAPKATDYSSPTVECTPQVSPSKQSTTQDRRSWDIILRNGLAGGMAGCAAKTIIAPLDRIRILFQTRHANFIHHSTHWRGILHAARDIVRYSRDSRSSGSGPGSERPGKGLTSLFKGHSATLLRIFPYAGINFLVYEQARGILIRDKQHETPPRRFMAGAVAGMIATAATYPMDVVRVRFAFEIVSAYTSTSTSTSESGRVSGCKHPQEQRSWVGMARKIYLEGGRGGGVRGRGRLRNFYRGFTPTMLGILPYAGTSFLMHDLMRDFFRSSDILAPYTVQRRACSRSRFQSDAPSEARSQSKRLTAPAQLTCGAVAGITAQTVSYPIEIIRRRMQVGNVSGSGSGTEGIGIVRTAKSILSERGIRGFYVGLSIGYVKMAPMVAVSFFVYDRLKGVLGVPSS